MSAPIVSPFRSIIPPRLLPQLAAKARAHLERPIRHNAVQGQLWERAGATVETPIIANCSKHGDVGTIRDNRGALLCVVCGGSVK